MARKKTSNHYFIGVIFPAIILFAFFALAQSADAATYYVKNGGNDSASGTSDATAWATIAKVNAGPKDGWKAGDDVYFKCGGTWSNSILTIDWSGENASNPAVVGAYYMNGNTAVNGVSGSRPIVQGALPADVSNCSAARFPADKALAMVTSDGRNHLKVENLRVQNVYGKGISLSNGSNINITGNQTYNCFNAGIVSNTNTGGLIDSNEVWQTGQIAKYLNQSLCGIEYINWPASIGVNRGTTGTTISRNHVYNNGGEGIGLYDMSQNNIVEHNILHGNRRVGIYWDGNYQIVRYNLIYNTTNEWSTENSEGIAVGLESISSSYINDGAEIYGNLIAYARFSGIRFGSAHDNSILRNAKIYNNTVIDTEGNNFKVGDKYTTFENVEFKNNIAQCITAGCVQATIPTVSGDIWDYNLWSSVPDPDAAGNIMHDPAYAAPQTAKTAGWWTMTGGSLSGSDFLLQAGSPAINKGTALGASYNRDFWNTLRPQGAGWDIGAHEYTTGGSDTTVPGAPSELSVR